VVAAAQVRGKEIEDRPVSDDTSGYDTDFRHAGYHEWGGKMLIHARCMTRA